MRLCAMGVCMGVCMCAHWGMHVCVHWEVCVGVCMSVPCGVHGCVFMGVCMCAHWGVHACMCMHVCTGVCMCVLGCACVCTLVCVCVFICTCVHVGVCMPACARWAMSVCLHVSAPGCVYACMRMPVRCVCVCRCTCAHWGVHARTTAPEAPGEAADTPKHPEAGRTPEPRARWEPWQEGLGGGQGKRCRQR